MTYQETCDYLFRQTPSFEKSGKTGFNEGLANTLALDDHYGHPHRAFKTIHVAGTNGKGSVSHTLAAHLQAAGYRVGLYTSPHLVDFRERIRINGDMIPRSYVVDFVADFLRWNTSHLSPLSSHLSPLTSPLSPLTSQLSPLPSQLSPLTPSPLTPSFFELTTALAFCYFRDQHVDIAVIEVGLGGRLDCTNIITPVLSVITNISLDHTAMLGNTLAKIAFEKAGIIKDRVPVVIGETTPETLPVFEAKARETLSTITFADEAPLVERIDDPAASPAAPLAHYRTTDGITFTGDLTGTYQLHNTNTALHALRQLQALGIIKEVCYEAFSHVAATTGLMARWQTLQRHPLMICDTGHNTGGWQYLSRQIAAVSCRQRHIVFGMVSDKDVDTVMQMLPRDAHYYFTQASTPRAIPADQIARKAQALGLQGQPYPTVLEAVNAALNAATDDDFIFIGGSTYVVAEYLKTKI